MTLEACMKKKTKNTMDKCPISSNRNGKNISFKGHLSKQFIVNSPRCCICNGKLTTWLFRKITY